MNICTNIEQSKHLLELGLNPETADMCYWEKLNDKYVLVPQTYYGESGFSNIPAWSISAMLELMPSSVTIEKYVSENKILYSCVAWGIHRKHDYNNPIDAAYNMLCYLVENNYIKTDKQ